VAASRDFRLLLIAGTVFYLGGMVSYVAIPYQVYVLTDSTSPPSPWPARPT
jgi:hypothetical protein